MKIRILAIALLAAFLNTESKAGFEQFSDPIGYMNVFEVGFGGVAGAYLWGSSWGVADLQAITSDNRTFELLPNVGQYEFGASQVGINTNDVIYWTNSDDDGLTAGPDGNKWMDGSCYFEIYPIAKTYTNASFTFTVDSNDLSNRYAATGFIKILDPNAGWGVAIQDVVPITTAGTYTVSIPMSGSNIGMDLQAGWTMSGINANPADDWGSVVVTATSLVAGDTDFTPPSPDPMTWATVPAAVSDSSITMTATTATDDNDVEYLFTNTVNGASSGWQSSPVWANNGLSELTQYGYQVKARDRSSQTNETAWSTPIQYATTFGSDTNAPLPDPAEIASTEASPITIQITAVTATDESAVEYYFASTNGNDSGWQSSPVYVDTGLNPDTEYSYTVTVRDLSASTNMTAESDPVFVTTLPLPASTSISNSLQGFSGNSAQGMTVHELAMAGFELADLDTSEKVVSFDGSGATFGSAPTWGSRNTLRTLGQDYGDADFEVYGTFVTQNTAEQAGFIGVGQGLIGAWGVPDFELAGVNSAAAEAQSNWCKAWTFTNGVFHSFTETGGITSSTNRFRMVHDTSTQTITFELDTDYNGTFAADRVLGTVTTTNLWEDMPQRIYIAAGAGVLWKDLEIITDSAPVVGVDDLMILPVSGGMQLQWTSVAGQTYDVLYKTSLNDATWTADPSDGCANIPGTGGSITATSTLGEDAAFYNISTE